jgi:hypothetical protein
MNLSQIKRQRNGKRGAVRTEAILLDGFMVLERSMDIDGADYLIQEIPANESEQKAPKDKTSATGRVQAKFFEKNNQQKIERSYVESVGDARPDFFVFLHTDDSNENNIYYFFTAQEIMANWNVSKCGKYYRFGLTAKKDYTFFRNRDRKEIFSLIKEGIRDSKYYQSLLAVERFYKIYVAVRETTPSPHMYTYLFKIIEGCHLVLCRDEAKKEKEEKGTGKLCTINNLLGMRGPGQEPSCDQGRSPRVTRAGALV